MQQEIQKFLSIPVAAEYLAEAGERVSSARLRAMINTKEIPCAVYWIVRDCWLYVEPRNAAHHEVEGWPRWAAARPEDLYADAEKPDPDIIWFTANENSPLLYNNLLMERIEQGGDDIGPSLQLAKFLPDLFIPEYALQQLAKKNLPKKNTVTAMPRSKAQDIALRAALRERDYDPVDLPKSTPGKPGVRAEIKDLLLSGQPGLFTESTFLHTWKRLLQEIKSNSQ